MLTLDECELSTNEITITPTIPVRENTGTVRYKLPKISFWMPPDVELVDSQSSCGMELKKGTQSTTFKIKAACKQGGVTGGLQAIVPHISHPNSLFWHPTKVGLPTIWVCIYVCMYLCMSFCYVSR